MIRNGDLPGRAVADAHLDWPRLRLSEALVVASCAALRRGYP